MRNSTFLAIAIFSIVAQSVYAQINTAKPVGVLEGKVNVSPDGSATYTVPIKLPRGVAGLQPALSLMYSSRSTDGLAGWGWNLTGLSNITRGSQTLFYNGLVAPLKMNASDNFYLEGQLLMPVTGTNGGNGTVYKTESENFSKIESFGGANGNPQWWRVTNKDGSTVEYGVAANDRLTATGNFIWFISNAKDVHNNAITYTYGRQGNEIFISGISYANVTVGFEYGTKQNSNVTFIYGEAFPNAKLLTNVVVKVNNIRQVNYKLTHAIKIKRHYLQTIEWVGTDNSQSVLTNFNYGNPDTEEQISVLKGTYQNDFSNVTLSPGDYDGDGKTDLVLAERKANVNGNNTELEGITSGAYNVITNVGVRTNGTIEPSKYELTHRYAPTAYMHADGFVNPYNYYSSDFNGNGKDGVLRTKKIYHGFQDNFGNWHQDGMNYTDSIFIENFSKAGTTLQLNSSYIALPRSGGLTYGFYLKTSNSFVQGDFDGDGKIDVISILGNKVQTGTTGTIIRIPVYTYNYKGFLTNISNGHVNSEILGIDNGFKDAKAIYPVDFDGDGKQELLVFKSYSYYLYAIEGVSAATGYSFKAVRILAANDIYYNIYKRILPGDFNGDRKTDFICIGTSQTATIFYSTGTAFNKGSVQLDRKPDYSDELFDFFTTGDFNGDGITDLFHYYSYPVTSSGGTSKYPKQSVHYFKGLNYTPPAVTTGQGNFCANDYIPYDNYTIMQVFPNDCFDDYELVYYDRWLIEYTDTVPAVYTPVFTKAGGFYEGMQPNMLYGSPPETGDFNGDGKAEIVQPTFGSEYALADAFGADKNSSLLQSVTDGFGNTFTFTYRSLAEKSSDIVYSNTNELTLSYPLNLMPLPMKVVTVMAEPNGIGGITNNVYRYEDAVFDRLKGFLGFRKSVTIKNNEIHERNESLVNTQYRVLIPHKTSIFYKEATSSAEESLNTVKTTFNVVPLSTTATRNYFFNRFKLQPLNTVETNGLSGSAVKKEFTYDGYNNVIKEIVQTGYASGNNVIPLETATTTTEYTQTGKALVPIFPVKLVISNAKNDGSTATKVITSTYAADKGLPATKTSWAETPLASTETYTYNGVGNLTQTITSVPGKPAVTTTITYDATQRFAVTNTASCDNVTSTTSTTYHPFWGVALSKTEGDGAAGSLATLYEYDALGKLTKTTTPLGHQVLESDVWDVSGQQTWYHYINYPDGVGADQKIWYDKLGRVIKKQTLAWNNKWHTQTQTYDSRGRESAATSPYYAGEQVRTHTNTYDRLSRPASVNTPSGTTTFTYSYPGNGQRVVTQVNAAGQTSYKKIDAIGHTIETSDHGGIVSYNYNERGKVISTAVNGLVMVTNTYDNYGRKTESVEANSGSVTYEYDAADNLIKQTDANGKVTTMVYDGLNRTISRTTQEGTTTWEYYNSHINKALKKVYNASHSQELVYDNYRRLVQKLEIITGEGNFNTGYEYNANNKLAATVYPGGTRIENQYNNAGLLTKVISNGAVLYEALEYDGEGHAAQFKLVNGLQSTHTYNQGLPARYYTPGVQDLNFNFQLSTGNLLSRTDAIKNTTEVFTYDNLNRLTSATVNNVQQFGITYDGNTSESRGNMAVKTDIGTYTYLNSKPHAVGYISPLTNTALANEPVATVTYTSFQRPAEIIKGNNTLNLWYGTDDERIKTARTMNGVTETRLFLGGYEKQTINNGTLNHIVYVAGGNGLCAMIINGVPHAVYTDYLGNILTVTNSGGTVVAQQNFDAWGRRRNVNDWTYNNIGEASLPAWLYRGFTGHEHLPAFGLINMNARLYDPYNGRMLSPDNVTSSAGGTQGYNKYSYCFNNPLSYVDASGDLPALAVVFIVAGALMGGYAGHEVAKANGYDLGDWQTYGFMLGGAIIGGGTAYLSVTMPLAGVSYFKTAIVTSQLSNMAWFMMTKGQSDMVYGYGPFSYNVTRSDFTVGWGPVDYNISENEWSWLGDKDNTWQDNFTFGLRTASAIYRQRESLFAVDKDKTPMGKVWQLTSRFTWEAPQTMLGMIVHDFYAALWRKENNLENKDAPPTHKGITEIKTKKFMLSAFTMGHVIAYHPDYDQHLPHEFGHTIQSRILGPAYLFVAGISIITASWDGLVNALNLPLGIHTSMPYEKWATRYRYKYFQDK